MRAVFGPETEKADGREAVRHAGALALSDARLLLFPVRTIGPAFAWVTCPLALARLRRDAAEAGIEGMPAVSEPPSDTHAVVPGSWKGGGVLLEEFSYEATVSRELGQLGGWIAERFLPASTPYDYWRELVRTALVLVTDADFRDFVRHATEVVTRVRLTAAKTVERGALWTEENLPSDTLLYSFVVAWPPANGASTDIDGAAAVMERVAGLVRARPVVQVGGKETVGRGFVAVRLTGGRDAQ
jgi:CRISPR-associated protein Cmr4